MMMIRKRMRIRMMLSTTRNMKMKRTIKMGKPTRQIKDNQEERIKKETTKKCPFKEHFR